MSFARAGALADAVLLEGYVLYPYRASSAKNRFRWTFGVLAPVDWSERGGCEPWWFRTVCLRELRGDGKVQGRLRFLQAERRTVEEAVPGGFRAVETLEVDGRLHVSWDEGRLREVDFEAAPGEGERAIPFEVPGHLEAEELRDDAGRLRGRVLRRRRPVRGAVRIAEEPVADGVRRLAVRVENLTPCTDPTAPRDEILLDSCLAAHLLLWAPGGGFVSATDPPSGLVDANRALPSVGTWPVLVGETGSTDLVLSAPVILYDYPRLAPESPGDFFDATEIDELLALRTSTLAPAEKRLARATDPRAAALLERVEALPPEHLQRLHGALREVVRDEMVPRFVPPAEDPHAPPSSFARGSRVRLLPARRRTDAQDLLFEGCTATVEAVLRDVDGREFLAVSLDDDPAKELHRWYGRFRYYHADEVELLPAADAREAGR